MKVEPPADRVAEVVEAALALDPAARAAFLAEACAGHGALRLEVESLLGFQAKARGFMETPAFGFNVAGIAAAPQVGGELRAGEKVGDCKILSLLGEGGMGEVYLAQDLALDRRVAVKLLRRGVGGETIIRRFQHERRVLAGLNHPHIARLYGGAVTMDGRPFLVMEYVEGERLDVYCERQALSVQGRLALFRKACSAVAYAHQNLVVHRDLKPGNILVTTDGEPKLLDFGIAKLLDPDATQGLDATLTLSGGAMTPGYASPEQLRGDPITTATDVYSLGVVLYELLTGQRPHRPTSGPENFARAIEGGAPTERPSVAVARTATTRAGRTPACGETAERLSRHLRGDLDNIVLMAMRAEPTRRYVSVTQFSEDLRRYSDGLPVVARKDTVGYRAEKFIRRNKTAVIAGFLVFLSLIAGVVATSREAARANRRFDDVRQLANSILFEVDPLMASLPGSIPVRTALVRHALQYLDSLAREAGRDRDLRRELATAYEKVGDVQGNPASANVGDIQGALASYAKARTLRLALVASDNHDARARHELANNDEQSGYILWWMNQTDRAVQDYNAALGLRKALLAEQPRSVDYRRGMASLEERIGDVPAWNNDTPRALEAYNVSLALRRELAAEQPGNVSARIDLARCLRRIGDTSKDSDDFDGALATLAQAQAIVEPLVHRSPPEQAAQAELWFIVFKRCELFLQKEDGEQAVALGPEMVSLGGIIAYRDPQNIEAQHKLANSHTYYASGLLLVKRYEESMVEYRKALEIDADLAVKSPKTGDFLRACADHRLGIGRAQRQLGQFDDAVVSIRAAIPVLEQTATLDATDLMTQHDLAEAYEQLGKVFVAQGKAADAHDALGQAIMHLQTIGSAHPLNKSDAGSLAELQGMVAALQR